MSKNRVYIRLNKIIRITMWSILSLLIALAVLLAFYVLSYKIAEKKGVNSPFVLATVVSQSMAPEINPHDVILIKSVDVKSLKIGNIITFYYSNAMLSETILTYRISDIKNIDGKIQIEVNTDKKGTHIVVYEENVLGKVILVIPKLGNVQTFLAKDGTWLFAILLPAFAVVSYDIVKLIKFFIVRKKNKEVDNEF